jgi:hypothetical protein
MPRKRRAIKKPLKGEQLIPLTEDRRPWYYAPLTVAANGLIGLFGIFQRPKKQATIAKLPRGAACRRRKS